MLCKPYSIHVNDIMKERVCPTWSDDGLSYILLHCPRSPSRKKEEGNTRARHHTRYATLIIYTSKFFCFHPLTIHIRYRLIGFLFSTVTRPVAQGDDANSKIHFHCREES